MKRELRVTLAFATVSLAAWALGTALASCSPSAIPPRELARGAVVAVAEATKTTDALCASLALQYAMQDRAGASELASRCADAYDVARPAIVASAEGVDAWDTGGRQGVVCGLAKAVPALQTMAGAIRAAGGKVPLLVDDSLRLVTMLGECK